MTKTKGEHFRCPDYLRELIEAEVAETGKTKTEIIARRLCKGYKIKYQPVEMGRPKKDPKS